MSSGSLAMSYMIEVMYREPLDQERDRRIAAIITRYSGEITFRESPDPDDISRAVVLTCEFESYERAEVAAAELRQSGEHVEGPTDY